MALILKGGQGWSNDPIHVQILIGTQPRHQSHIVQLLSRMAVTLVKRLIFGPGIRVVGIAFVRGILIGQAGLGLNLTSQMFVFSDACIVDASSFSCKQFTVSVFVNILNK